MASNSPNLTGVPTVPQAAHDSPRDEVHPQTAQKGATSGARPRRLPRSHLEYQPVDILSHCAILTTKSVAPPRHPTLVLSKACPSIRVLAGHMAQAMGDIERFYLIAASLSASLMSVERSLLGNLPREIAESPEFQSARSPVVFTVKQFVSAVKKYEELKSDESKHAEWMSIVNDLFSVVSATLNHAFNVARRISTAAKPLPPTPRASFIQGTTQPSQLSTLDSHNSNCNRQSKSSITTSNPFDNPAYVVYDPRARNSEQSTQSAKAPTQATYRSSIVTSKHGKHASFITLVESPTAGFSQASLPLTESTLASESTIRTNHTGTDVTYVPRQSDIFFPPDPLHPDIDVTMPLPTELLTVRKDVTGRTRAASLPALVRLLTSKEAIHDPELTTTFFLCFRLFCTPSQLVRELMALYHEQPPSSLDDAQRRVFKRELSSLRFRVAKVLITWLEQYWRPSHDAEALRTIQTFIESREDGELPRSLTSRMNTALLVIESCSKSGRSIRRVKCIERQLKPPLPPPPDPTPFTLDPRASNHPHGVLIFNTDSGIEELARQLTIYAHELFIKIDPEDAVMEWRKAQQLPVVQDIQRLQEFERAMTLWVIDTIVRHDQVGQRAEQLGFWVSLATRCCAHRNFCAAFSIYCGIETTAIRRLKQTHTVLRKQFQPSYLKLGETFSYARNWVNYRALLAQTPHLPTVPLLVCFKRDIVTSDETVPATVHALQQQEDNIELVNLRAYEIVAKTIETMEACLLPYQYSKRDNICSWIRKALTFYNLSDERRVLDGFLERSYHVEPRGMDVPEPGWMQKLKSEHGIASSSLRNKSINRGLLLTYVLDRGKKF
ncbi:hypothetical protein AX16_007967 [Volvariella volvacea WC 439]|nr:hypothetical protein AX16_007967 [Volvariella volvacea WC 439]